MLDLLIAGGWVMVPLGICSILALAIIIERSWQLRLSKVVPQGLSESIVYDLKNKNLNQTKLSAIAQNSELGELLVVGIEHINKDRATVVEYLEESGRKIMHNLEKNLNMLSIIATISPLLGLLGTVFGMINIFSAISEYGAGNASTLAAGISQALITTAAGLTIAIPSLFFYKSFQRRLDEISYRMEQQAIVTIDLIRNTDKTITN